MSAGNPHGLPRTALAWLTNGTVRGGGVQGRYGWQKIATVATNPGMYQGGFLYEPTGANPYLVLAIGGSLHLVAVEDPLTTVNLSALYGLTNPPTEPMGYFTQAEEFLVFQPGDTLTLPLFWDGVTLKRSNGINGNLSGPNVSQLPAATCMAYHAGRIWYAQDRIYTAGDIARGAAGTAPYARRDSVVCVTENPLAFGGDGFSVPTNAGGIRALTFPANLDTALGQGPLLIGTRKTVYSLTVPVSRTDWTAATDNQPLQVVAQIKWGPVNDRSVTHVNGDVFYQTIEPGVRSLAFARRSYGQWANVPISNNVRRIVRRNDRALLRFASGINWDNRLWQTALPEQTDIGVVHRAMVIMDFDPLSSLEEQLPPIWEGSYEGLGVLQLFEGDFGGLQRAFAAIVSETGAIEVWELTREGLFENGDNRITWGFESPAFTWADSIGELELKKLVGAEMYFDRVFGTARITVEYRPDSHACWILWHEFEVCSARSSAEDPWETDHTGVYPEQPYAATYQPHKALPHPPAPCVAGANRPANIGLQFQVRVTVKGCLRIRSLFLFAEHFERQAYYGQTC